jgi:hypothetical protein
MVQNFVINIGIYKLLTLLVALITGAWYLSYRLTRVETKVEDFGNIISGFDGRLINLSGRMDKAYSSSSPISLLPKGITILEDSGLKKFIDEKKDELLSTCKQQSVMTNPYDIQQAAFKFFDEFKFDKEIEDSLKLSAYKHGVSMDTIRRTGGIYFRDICLSNAGFKIEDLDTPKSEEGKI